MRKLRIHAEKWVKINGSMHIWTFQVSSFKTNTHNPIKVYIYRPLCGQGNDFGSVRPSVRPSVRVSVRILVDSLTFEP